ncbi:hypothetical protein [Methanosarcina barkeri]|uniref:hypothetical protein n=1 Tax=Methanosarcina barkeri TaxID=2208 RepID=UPI0018B092F2|nr:hypothetical protein [Methanosarcina barkeri]
MFELKSSPNPIGVINRRNGFDQPAQRLRVNGCGSTVVSKLILFIKEILYGLDRTGSNQKT